MLAEDGIFLTGYFIVSVASSLSWDGKLPEVDSAAEMAGQRGFSLAVASQS